MTPSKIKPLSEILKEHPELESFSRLTPENEKFKMFKYTVVTKPKNAKYKNIIIYGVFVLSKENIFKNLIDGKTRHEIKQDFLELDTSSNEYLYYSGGANSFPDIRHKSMKEFFSKFGKDDEGNPQYGFGGFTKLNHRYMNENDNTLPIEPEFRDSLKAEIELIRINHS